MSERQSIFIGTWIARLMRGFDGQTRTDAPADDLVERLERDRYQREDWHEPYGAIDLPCDAEDFGAQAVPVNPDGPEAAARIRSLEAQRDEAVGLIAMAGDNPGPGWQAARRAFLDSLKKKDHDRGA